MRIVFISTMRDWPWGGSEELWSRSASQLRRAGAEVYVSLFHWSQNRSRVQVMREQGITVETRSGIEAGPARRMLRRLSGDNASFGRMRRFAPDLVLISQGHNRGGFEWAKACREAGIPYAIIVQCNCELWWFDDRELDDAVAAYTHAHKVFCVSQANLELLRFQLGETLPNACVVWNPCNVTPDSAPGWPDTEPLWHLANVARLDPAAKGQDILLRILAESKWRGRPVQLDFFGTGPYEGALRRIAESLNLERVAFHGHISDVHSIWQRSHLLVLPSRYEGLPLALVEAMLCARPAVVTDVGGNAELCIDQKTGFVAQAATSMAFEDALERAWQSRDNWRAMGLAARAHAVVRVPQDPVTLFCEEVISCVAIRGRTEAVAGVP